MTLNITVATPRCVYQSADYRLQDLTSSKTFDSDTHKIVLANGYRWSATVCFAGVGRTQSLDVGKWLAECVAAIQPDDPFDKLLEMLQSADTWLSGVAGPAKRHSFSVGAFVGSQPVFALVSNYETLSGPPAKIAAAMLSVIQFRPTRAKTFISGQRQFVSQPAKRRLETLASRDPAPMQMYSALAELNRGVAMRTQLVSPACFTAHVRLTGEGGGYAHGIGDRPFLPPLAIPGAAHTAVMRLLDEQLGPGRARLVSISTARADASDEFHETQVREKPNDPSVHSNYGAYLLEKKGDVEGAEREYRRAIALDDSHVNALGNLANLMSKKGGRNEAEELYRKALEADPANVNVACNYASFLVRERGDRSKAREVLDRGIVGHPDSGRLLLDRAELSLLDEAPSESLECFGRAREKGADQARVEAGYACALHLSGAPPGESIGAYQVAVGLNPKNGALRLNLSQLLFITGDDMQANSQLHKAMALGLDESAQLEALFYLLAHTPSDAASIFEKIKSLLAKGARLQWNVRPNIEVVSRRDPQKAALLALVSKVMVGEAGQESLDQVHARWGVDR